MKHSYPEYKHLWEGIFNLGFCAARRTDSTNHFLAWWSQRLLNHCYADHLDGLHTDQKWMDYAPVYLGNNLHIVRKQGVNVAHWNLSERPLSIQSKDKYYVNEEPLILFHFSGFDFLGSNLTRHSPAENQKSYSNQHLSQLTETYRRAVHANGYTAHIQLPYCYNHFDNGQPITPLHRRLYRALGGAQFDPSPFDHRGKLYQELRLRGLLDDSAAALQAHASGTLPALKRWTRLAETALRLFLRVFGAKHYAYLLKFFRKYGRVENHVFLLQSDASPNAQTADSTGDNPSNKKDMKI
jgi:hypothetical protein